jgi:hypothetical protein
MQRRIKKLWKARVEIGGRRLLGKKIESNFKKNNFKL